MAKKTLSGFKGIDLRKLPTASPMDTFRKALNVDLTVNGGITSRDPFVPFAQVDANSVGLYSLGGQLRCAIAGGHGIVPPPGMVYDEIGHGGTAYALDSVVAVTGWETIGTSTLTGLMPYLVIQRNTVNPGGFPVYEHHWIQAPVSPYQTFTFAGLAGASQVLTTVAYDTTVSIGLGPARVSVNGVPMPSREVAFTDSTHITLTPASAFVGGEVISVLLYAATPTVPDTFVKLPFRPGPFLIKMVEKLWAVDTYNNTVPYSSVTNGPTDWTFENDAGELPTQNQTSGDRTITGLAAIEGQLVVFFDNCIQAWTVYADPTNPSFGIQKVVNGPGTIVPYTIDNVRGDLLYFSQGAFRQLQKNLLTGQFREGDLGKEIWPLTKTIDLSALTEQPFGRWFQSRQQYICFMGAYAYCYLDCTLDGQTNSGWTMWQLPGEVVAAAELDGVLYFRIGDIVYQAVNEGDPALLEPTMRWDVRSQLFDGGDHHTAKDWQHVEMDTLGTGDLNFYDDASHPDTPAGDGIPFDGVSADGRSWTPVQMNSYYMGFGFQGSGLLQLEQLDVYYTQLKA